MEKKKKPQEEQQDGSLFQDRHAVHVVCTEWTEVGELQYEVNEVKNV